MPGQGENLNNNSQIANVKENPSLKLQITNFQLLREHLDFDFWILLFGSWFLVLVICLL